MNPSSWALRPRPEPENESRILGRWEPAVLADLTAGRRQLAAAVQDGGRAPGVDLEGIERLLLVYEELTSNALRHGRGPVEVTVTSGPAAWLLEVSDATAARPPDPAIGRDPAQGGLGLHLVARICAAHGWTVDGDRKVVWARIDHAWSPC